MKLIESIREVLDVASLEHSMRSAHLTSHEAAMMVDMAIKGIDDALKSFHNAMELLPSPQMQIQGASLGLQLLEFTAGSQHKTLVALIEGKGGTIFQQLEDGTVETMPGTKKH